MMEKSFEQSEYLGRGVLRAGSFYISGANVSTVIYYRNDFSGHGDGQPHDNIDIAVSVSGGRLTGVKPVNYKEIHIIRLDV